MTVKQYVNVRCEWQTDHELEVPEGMTEDDFIDAINNGHLETIGDWPAEATSAGAELVNWKAR